jgi:hypothetical protein
MIKHIIGVFIFFFCSCNTNEKRIILYEFNGVYVTRIDDNTDSFFYFGKFNDGSNLPKSYVKSTFNGINSGMDAFLIFNPNNVEIYYTMEYFENIGKSKSIKVINKPKTNTFNYNFDEKVKGKYNNVCRVSDILTREQELNLNNHSKVKVIYP